jgi:hypothetical protein
MSEDGFKTTFVVDVAPQAVWEAIARSSPPGSGSPGDPVRYHLPGFEAWGVPLEVEPGRLLRVRKDEEPCKGTEIAVVIEAAGSGTRVTVVQSGFGPILAQVLESFRTVWTWIVADLALYVERRIRLETHLFATPPPRASLGVRTEERTAGLHVSAVEPGSFGARVGLQAGDLLLTLNDVRLVNGMQLLDLLRICDAGSELRVQWARGDQHRSAAAVL